MFGTCLVEAEDAAGAWRKIDNKTWDELESKGYEPEIFDNTVDKDESVEVTMVEKEE
jgi:hypothetical protein